MSQISQKSISGITSITTPAGVDNQFSIHTNNTSEALKLDHAGNIHIHNHVNTTGISSASNFKTGSSNLHSTGLTVGDSFVHSTGFNVGSNIKLGSTGVVTATTFSGSGASLTSIPAGNLTGTVADARISTLTASKLTGALPSLNAANLTNIPAGNLTGTVADARISTLTASKLTGALPAISGANLTGLASREFYGFTGIGNSLSLTTTNSGADNIDNATYVAFEQSFIGPSGISFSINTSGNLIMTI